MIVTVSAVEPFGDYGVGVHTSEPPGFTACFGSQSAQDVVRRNLTGPDDRLQVRGEEANPVFVETLNALLGTSYKPWEKVPDGFFSITDLKVPA